MAAPLSGGAELFVDILPDTSRFGERLKAQLTAQSASLKRSSEQLSKSMSASFSGIGSSVGSATDKLGDFGDATDKVSVQTKRSFLPNIAQANSKLDLLNNTIGGGIQNTSLFSNTVGFIKWPALINGANLAAAGVSSLAAAGTAAVAALGPLAGLAAAFPALRLAGAQAMGVFKLATSGVAEALGAAVEGGEAFKEALKKLPPAARAFTVQVAEWIPKFERLREIASENFLGPVGDALPRLTKLFPIVRGAVADTASAMGNLANQAIKLVSSGAFARDFETVAGRNVKLIGTMGKAGLNLADALRHIVVAAGPLTQWLADLALGWSKNLKGFFAAERESGGLARFFESTRETVERLVSILGHLGRGLTNVFAAARPLGEWLLERIDKLAESWADWTDTVAGRNALRDWFQDAKPVMTELGKLVRDVARIFGDMAKSEGLSPLIKQLRTQMLPVLADILKSSSGKLLPAIVELGTNFLKLFKIFGTETGPLIVFVKTLSRIAKVIADMLESQPLLANMVITLGSFSAILKATSFASFLLGGRGMARMLTGLIGQYKVLAGVQAATTVAAPAAGAGGAAAGAAGLTGAPIGASLAIGAGALRGLDILTDKLHEAGGMARHLGGGIRDALNAATAGGFSLVNKGFDLLQEKLFGVNQELRKGKGFTKEAAEALNQHRQRLTGSAEAMKDFTAVTRHANDVTTTERDKLAAVIGGLHTLGGELNKTERATVSNLLKTGDYSGALRLLKDAVERVTDRHAKHSDRLRGTQDELGAAKDAADRYRGSLNAIPRGKDTDVDVKTRNATEKIADYLKLLEAVPGQISTTTLMQTQGAGLPLAQIPGGKSGSAAAMAASAMSAVPGPQVITSGYRSGDPGYHGDASNPAQDISGAQSNGVFIYGQAIYNHLLSTYGRNIREMIWAHDRWEGGQHNYWPASDHFDHVHVADQGGTFKGPGLVKIGNIQEEVSFQPLSNGARKTGPSPQGDTYNIYVTADPQDKPGLKAAIRQTLNEDARRKGRQMRARFAT